MDNGFGKFVWGIDRELANIAKHGIDFTTAARAFLDIKRKIIVDSKHSFAEKRYFCMGRVDDKILTVRFTYRKRQIRIFGAGYWRKGKMYYEE